MPRLDVSALLEDWDTTRKRRPRPRRVGNFESRRKSSPSTFSAPARTPQARLNLYAKKAPEVMVKVSGGGKNRQHIGEHLRYISRNGDLDLENERGETFQGKEGLRDLRDEWAQDPLIPKEPGRYRAAINLVLSMPPGTDRDSVKSAARDFARDLFKDHEWVMVEHKDTKHPHVHVCVKAIDKHGWRLSPGKAELQHWREMFAEKLFENGLEAKATPRLERFKIREQSRELAPVHIQKAYKEGKRNVPSWVLEKGQKQAAKPAPKVFEKVWKSYHEAADILDRCGESGGPQLREAVNAYREQADPEWNRVQQATEEQTRAAQRQAEQHEWRLIAQKAMDKQLEAQVADPKQREALRVAMSKELDEMEKAGTIPQPQIYDKDAPTQNQGPRITEDSGRKKTRDIDLER